MKDKNKSNVEYLDFKSLSKEKENRASSGIAHNSNPHHSNPIMDRLFKFVHNKLTKFEPKDLF
ncbi:MAG: hypothetical protein A2Y25_06630 [Candidatus Melainabacteria bacterium GWF2_37_15]|nr:MAG: hypothetical protein A2Y25_06630 [Candidatus Melainabacteria bacterium GWF2_37_15]